MIKLIWAQTKNGVIGNNNSLPWDIKEEMQHFRRTTTKKDLVMGRKTFASLNYKPLKNRLNYVLTNNVDKYKDLEKEYDNLIIINSVDPIIEKYAKNQENEIFVIGGKIIYELFLDSADEIIRSIIKKDYQGDTFMRDLDVNKFDKISQEDYEEFYIERWVRK
ncbi:Dihydrofolate reductase [Mycoplasma yeatsii 13926]|uniref:dihydrofolate reductase n=1 Tax=Mycoplasma yeatsii 13926 TaxID=1188240 RepID=S6G7W5_9MOLU|nr:dihydrofolate reductase [Mycoplasma yeatsii]EOA06984.1 Dihydrofolate reductase [Mycoplasma yeatsii 13926]